MDLYTHLNFGGNCEEAFRFYAEHLGGEVTTIVRWNEMPGDYEPPPGFENAVVHARMNVAGTELIGNDVPRQHFQPIRSSYIYLALDSPEEAERVWEVLSEGGQVGMPLAETIFAARFGQLRDRFGVLWSISHQRPM